MAAKGRRSFPPPFPAALQPGTQSHRAGLEIDSPPLPAQSILPGSYRRRFRHPTLPVRLGSSQRHPPALVRHSLVSAFVYDAVFSALALTFREQKRTPVEASPEQVDPMLCESSADRESRCSGERYLALPPHE